MPYLTCKETTCVYPWIWLSSVVLLGNCNSKNRHSALGDTVLISPVQILLYCRPRFPIFLSTSIISRKNTWTAWCSVSAGINFHFPLACEHPLARWVSGSRLLLCWKQCMSCGALLMCCGVWGGTPVSFASSATVESKKSHQSTDVGFVSPASLWSALCFTLSVRMVSMVQPPVSSLLLHARVADGVSAHL